MEGYMWSIYDHIRLLSRWDRAVGLTNAINSAVEPGNIVFDVGCGSGICSLLALKNGASKAVGVDLDPVDLAIELIKDNELSEHVLYIQADLKTLILEEYLNKFDVLISMIYNNDPRRDELQSSIILDLKNKYLKPYGRILPDRVRYLAYACDWPTYDIKKQLLRLDRDIAELQGRYQLAFNSFRSQTKNQVDRQFFPVKNFQNGRIQGNDKIPLSKPASFCEIDYYNDTFSYPSLFTIEISSSGRLNSIIWIQELWYREILIFSNESLSYIINAREVEPGEKVTVLIDDEWRKSNILKLTS
jgi:SAM-dependent methyltransferase